MKRSIGIIVLMTLFIISCDQVKNKTKSTINKGGEVVGKTATEFIEGVSEGVDRTLQCEISLSDKLINNGVKTGKYSIENSQLGGENNVFVVYLIFDKALNAPITVKAFDKKGIEIGRSKLDVAGKAGDAGYYEFEFDKRTYIEARGKLILE